MGGRIAVLGVVSGILLAFGGRGDLTTKAAVYGTVAGILFGLSAPLTKPTLTYLHAGISELLSHWEPYALAIAGVVGFVLQQVSLGTGSWPRPWRRSRPRIPVGILLGILLLDERLSRPAWHMQSLPAGPDWRWPAQSSSRRAARSVVLEQLIASVAPA